MSAPPRPKSFIGAVEDEWQLYSDRSSDYTIGSPIGFGASSTVYTAHYKPPPSNSRTAPIPCALKVLDLDSLPPHSLSLLQRETTLMSLSKHPNVLRVRGSWMDGHKLYIAMRLMNKGSAADVMRYGWPGGMEEDVVRCILRQALLGLNYLHINGFIHRDVKAANLLIDDDGTVLLGDLGVAANLAEEPSDTPHHSRSRSAMSAMNSTGSTTTSTVGGTKRIVVFDPTLSPKIRKRKSFVGTPCWMAPELIQGRRYDFAADIWSFGITALELTQGRPPRSRESPQRVLLKTIQEAPPTLDRENGTYKYSRAFKEVVESCLVKDPSKRPTAEQLLQTPFFKAAKKKSYLVGAILKDLPPLTQRQERRRNPALLTQVHRSIDSWDFASTVSNPGSPTTSIYRRRVLEDLDLMADHLSASIRHKSWTVDEPLGADMDWVGDEVRIEDAVVYEQEEEEGNENGPVQPDDADDSLSSSEQTPSVSSGETSETDSPPSTPGPVQGLTESSDGVDNLVLPPPSLPLSIDAPISPNDLIALPPKSVSPSLPSLLSTSLPGSSFAQPPTHPPLIRRTTDPLFPTSLTVKPPSSPGYPTLRPSTSSLSYFREKPRPSTPRKHTPAPLVTNNSAPALAPAPAPAPAPSLWRKLTNRTVVKKDSEEKLKTECDAREKDRRKTPSRVGSLFARKAEAGKDALVRTTSRTAHAVGFK